MQKTELLLKKKTRRISLWLKISFQREKKRDESLILIYTRTFGESLGEHSSLAKVSQFGWLGTPNNGMPSEFSELGMCCSNHQTQSPIVTQVSKALSRQSSGENHKRTQQGVSAKFESYIYRIHMVCATSSCPPHFLLKATMLYTCVLMSSSRSFYYILGLWRHIMWYVMWLQCHMPLHRH